MLYIFRSRQTYKYTTHDCHDIVFSLISHSWTKNPQMTRAHNTNRKLSSGMVKKIDIQDNKMEQHWFFIVLLYISSMDTVKDGEGIALYVYGPTSIHYNFIIWILISCKSLFLWSFFLANVGECLVICSQIFVPIWLLGA